MLTGTLNQVSNRATLELLVNILDAETGEPILLDDLILVAQLTPSGDWPWVSDNPTLRASSEGGTTGEINIIDLGVCQILFPASAMRVCAPRVYDVGLTAKVDDDDICQIFVGSIAIIEGVVTSP
jgi:hypothetical protein